jgi:hypothetical protein
MPTYTSIELLPSRRPTGQRIPGPPVQWLGRYPAKCGSVGTSRLIVPNPAQVSSCLRSVWKAIRRLALHRSRTLFAGSHTDLRLRFCSVIHAAQEATSPRKPGTHGPVRAFHGTLTPRIDVVLVVACAPSDPNSQWVNPGQISRRDLQPRRASASLLWSARCRDLRLRLHLGRLR